jgi:hypothetical protein
MIPENKNITINSKRMEYLRLLFMVVTPARTAGSLLASNLNP